MAIVNYTLKTIFSQRIRAIDNFKRYPERVQHNQFVKLMKFGDKSAFFNAHSIDSSTQYEKFRANVPISTYEQLWPWIELITKGTKNVLSREKVRWFARSSGTTNSISKYIPIGNSSLDKCHMMGGRDTMLAAILNYPNTKAFSGKTLILGGSQQLLNESCGIEAGDLSSILINNTPSWIAWRKAPKPSIALIANFEEKVKKITDSVLKEHITSFAGVPSWNLVLLENILKVSGKSNLLELWPDMSLFMHGGISFEPYREIYKNLIPNSDQMKYIETYNASEGFFGLQDDKDDKSMLLMLDYGTFYEFVPVDSLNNPTTAVPLEGVKTGVNYAMIISTLGGLWRYQIGDTIEFTSVKPYKFIITGRTKQYLNAFGEEVMVDNVEKAMSATCKQTGAEINEYTVAPLFMTKGTKGAHLWVVEFKKEPENIDNFSLELDNNLRKLNSDYNAKRSGNSTMNQLQIKVVPKGTFYKWQKDKGKLGGQNKTPRLSSNLKVADEIIAIATEIKHSQKC